MVVQYLFLLRVFAFNLLFDHPDAGTDLSGSNPSLSGTL